MWPHDRTPEVEPKAASNHAAADVRQLLRNIAPPKSPQPPPPVEEGAWLTRFDSKIYFSERSGVLGVTSRKITVQFTKDKVSVIGAADVRLFSSVGLRFKNRGHTIFTLEDVISTKIRLCTTPGESVWFYYGPNAEVLFVLDQVDLVAKVWADDFGYDFVKGGMVHFCTLEPRPTIEIPKTGPIQMQLEL